MACSHGALVRSSEESLSLAWCSGGVRRGGEPGRIAAGRGLRRGAGVLGPIVRGVALSLSLACVAVACAGPPLPPVTAAQRAQVRVVLYATRWCPACAGARAWLRRRGIAYEERDVEISREASARLVALNPRRTVPTIDVEGRVVVGFAEEELRVAIDAAARRH